MAEPRLTMTCYSNPNGLDVRKAEEFARTVFKRKNPVQDSELLGKPGKKSARAIYDTRAQEVCREQGRAHPDKCDRTVLQSLADGITGALRTPPQIWGRVSQNILRLFMSHRITAKEIAHLARLSKDGTTAGIDTFRKEVSDYFLAQGLFYYAYLEVPRNQSILCVLDEEKAP